MSSCIKVKKQSSSKQPQVGWDLSSVAIASLQSVYLGVLPFEGHGDAVPTIKVQALGTELVYSLSFCDRAGVVCEEHMNEEDIEQIIWGDLDDKTTFLAFQVKECMDLSTVAIGPEGGLNPQLTLDEALSLLPHQSKYIVAVFNREDWLVFKERHDVKFKIRSKKKIRDALQKQTKLVSALRRMEQTDHGESRRVHGDARSRATLPSLIPAIEERSAVAMPMRRTSARLKVPAVQPEMGSSEEEQQLVAEAASALMGMISQRCEDVGGGRSDQLESTEHAVCLQHSESSTSADHTALVVDELKATAMPVCPILNIAKSLPCASSPGQRVQFGACGHYLAEEQSEDLASAATSYLSGSVPVLREASPEPVLQIKEASISDDDSSDDDRSLVQVAEGLVGRRITNLRPLRAPLRSKSIDNCDMPHSDASSISLRASVMIESSVLYLVMGLLPYRKDCRPKLTVKQEGHKLAYHLAFQRNGVLYTEDMDEEHIEYILAGTMGRFCYLAFLPKDTMVLKTVFIGEDRMLNPNLNIGKTFNAASSSAAKDQGKYIVLVFTRENWLDFDAKYATDIKAKKVPLTPTPYQYKYIHALIKRKRDDVDALFARVADETVNESKDASKAAEEANDCERNEDEVVTAELSSLESLEQLSNTCDTSAATAINGLQEEYLPTCSGFPTGGTMEPVDEHDALNSPEVRSYAPVDKILVTDNEGNVKPLTRVRRRAFYRRQPLRAAVNQSMIASHSEVGDDIADAIYQNSEQGITDSGWSPTHDSYFVESEFPHAAEAHPESPVHETSSCSNIDVELNCCLDTGRKVESISDDDSDDDRNLVQVTESYIRHSASAAKPTCPALPISNEKPLDDIAGSCASNRPWTGVRKFTRAMFESASVNALCLFIGLLPYRKDCRPRLTAKREGDKIVYHLVFQRNGVFYSEDLDDEHIEYIIAGPLGTYQFMAFLPKDTMVLKTVSIGEDRMLNPNLEIGKGIRSSSTSFTTDQGKYIILVFAKEAWLAFDARYVNNVKAVKLPQEPTKDQHDYIQAVVRRKRTDLEALFAHVAKEKAYDSRSTSAEGNAPSKAIKSGSESDSGAASSEMSRSSRDLLPPKKPVVRQQKTKKRRADIATNQESDGISLKEDSDDRNLMQVTVGYIRDKTINHILIGGAVKIRGNELSEVAPVALPPIQVKVHRVVVGFLPYFEEEGLSSTLTVRHESDDKLVYSLIFYRNGIQYCEDMDDDDIGYIIGGKVGANYHFLAFLPAETMVLKTVSIGVDRLLNPKLILKPATSSEVLNQGKYIVVVIKREDWSGFGARYLTRIKGKKAPLQPTGRQNAHIVNILNAKRDDLDELFQRCHGKVPMILPRLSSITTSSAISVDAAEGEDDVAQVNEGEDVGTKKRRGEFYVVSNKRQRPPSQRKDENLEETSVSEVTDG